MARQNLPPERQAAYKASLLRILKHGNALLAKGASALDAATSTVSLFEDDPLFNCGRGAVFNRAGGIELEASIMVSGGFKKKGAAVSLLKHVKNPILLVKKILENGQEDMEHPSAGDVKSAQGHVHLSGSTAEALAAAYGLELRPQKYFWTRKRWEEHKRGLKGGSLLGDIDELWENFTGSKILDSEDPPWDGHEFLPQGTVGCVVMDSSGMVCAATSTGGLTNKLPGRIGDTPTFGAGFWAEGSSQSSGVDVPSMKLGLPALQTLQNVLAPVAALVTAVNVDCLPIKSLPLRYEVDQCIAGSEKGVRGSYHVLGLSGTGNGDSFLRVAACRTAASLALPPQIPAHLVPHHLTANRSSGIDLRTAVSAVAGHDGILQQSADDRWGRTGEGEGGIIGIERRGEQSSVVFDFNCGGMFRGYVDDGGDMRVGIFKGDDDAITESN